MDAKIEQLKAKAAELGEDAKVEFQKAIVELEAMKDKAKKKLDALKKAGSEAWQDAKPALNEAMDNLKDAFEKAKSHF
jgi:hypothetical protein